MDGLFRLGLLALHFLVLDGVEVDVTDTLHHVLTFKGHKAKATVTLGLVVHQHDCFLHLQATQRSSVTTHEEPGHPGLIKHHSLHYYWPKHITIYPQKSSHNYTSIYNTNLASMFTIATATPGKDIRINTNLAKGGEVGLDLFSTGLLTHPTNKNLLGAICPALVLGCGMLGVNLFAIQHMVGYRDHLLHTTGISKCDETKATAPL